MYPWKPIHSTVPVVIAWIILIASSDGQTSSRLSSFFLARGEQAQLDVAVAGAKNIGIPELPQIQNITIQQTSRGPKTNILAGRILEYSYTYIVSGYEVGKYTIPPVTVVVDGIKTQSEAIEFEIFNPDELQWLESPLGQKNIRYASMFRALNNEPFENETTPTEIKIFIPEDTLVVDWGIPAFDRDGVAAWRFQPTPKISKINLLGRPYISVAYPSTITPTRVGKVSIGPAKIRLITQEQVLDPFPRAINAELHLEVPKLEIKSKTLPPNAPVGFENAVGNFKLSATTLTTEIQEGDPISIDLIVSGNGNLDTMRPPTLENLDGWKVYGTTTEQRNDERRQLSGSVTSHQSIRPLEMKSEIPPFRLVYFDPKEAVYKTILTEPIALQMTPNTAANGASMQTLAVPVERMTDILSILHPSQLTFPTQTPFAYWWGHFLAGLVALGLIIKAFLMRYPSLFKSNPRRLAWNNELKDIEKSQVTHEIDFLKIVGHFIERWHGTSPPAEIQSLLVERDAVCFLADKQQAVIQPARRQQILQILRNATIAFVCFAVLGFGTHAHASDTATQAKEAYESAKYDEAIKLWFSAGTYDQLSADTLYNIGNACYRSGSPGQAALYYRRALTRNTAHPEARQNLRFIERKYGAIVVQRPQYQHSLAKISLPVWQLVFWSGIWLSVLALLVFPATKQGAKLRLTAVGILIFGPLIISIGILGWRYFPDDAEFAPLAKQAVIVSNKTALYSDASRTAPEVIDAPLGSLCEIISESGRWVYVAFATKTRGWLPIECIEKIILTTPPPVPKFRKPKADDKTA
jgi:tetratricopeptide (TPR) repeat protein